MSNVTDDIELGTTRHGRRSLRVALASTARRETIPRHGRSPGRTSSTKAHGHEEAVHDHEGQKAKSQDLVYPAGSRSAHFAETLL